ncbi:MAG: four helix bundle protein [Oscillatoriales cyanobacterium RM1_1_9]|nr:four helix bundle protein [Oscillatoriales cyanobacterium RM2_1_1]NJO71725.1 four helix bundle protein [Oscillatoriales cyanobacterium RM1_1_9]
MVSESLASERAYQFALQIVYLYKYLGNEKKEFTLSQKLLNSGTRIGAEVASAESTPSEIESATLLSLAHKYAVETQYWLRLLKDTGYLAPELFNSISTEAEALAQLLRSKPGFPPKIDEGLSLMAPDSDLPSPNLPSPNLPSPNLQSDLTP